MASNPTTQDRAFSYFVANQAALRRMVVSVLRGRGIDRVDEIMSDVILEKLPRLIANRDDDRGAFSTYAQANLRWYVWKWAKRQDIRRNDREQPLRQDSPNEDWPRMAAALEAADTVAKLQRRLNRDQMRLLVRRYAEELPVDVICDIMQIGRSTFYTRLREAMELAREVLRDAEDGE